MPSAYVTITFVDGHLLSEVCMHMFAAYASAGCFKSPNRVSQSSYLCRAKARADWQKSRQELHAATATAGHAIVSPADSLRYMVCLLMNDW